MVVVEEEVVVVYKTDGICNGPSRMEYGKDEYKTYGIREGRTHARRRKRDVQRMKQREIFKHNRREGAQHTCKKASTMGWETGGRAGQEHKKRVDGTVGGLWFGQ